MQKYTLVITCVGRKLDVNWIAKYDQGFTRIVPLLSTKLVRRIITMTIAIPGTRNDGLLYCFFYHLSSFFIWNPFVMYHYQWKPEIKIIIILLLLLLLLLLYAANQAKYVICNSNFYMIFIEPWEKHYWFVLFTIWLWARYKYQHGILTRHLQIYCFLLVASASFRSSSDHEGIVYIFADRNMAGECVL